MDREQLERRFKQAGERLQKLAASNAPLGSRINAEVNYAATYQDLVRAGFRPQIRAKHRERKG